MIRKNPNHTSKVSLGLSVKWSQKYNDIFTVIWKKIPWPLNDILVFCAVLMLGISMNGGWVNLWVYISRQLGYYSDDELDTADIIPWNLESIGLKDLWKFFVSSIVSSYLFYFSIGGFLHWYYYVRQRDRPEEWKCQPNKFMDPDLAMEEFIFGCINLFLQSSTSSVLACYIANGGYSTVYYNFEEYTWTWFFLQIIVIFLYQDYVTYWIHRMFHTPWFYRNFHFVHHKYTYPTMWSTTILHPFEAFVIQAAMASPLFLFPVHWIAFQLVVFHAYYHGIIGHSGINFKSFWWQPWQHDAMFHDNHHQYFHVNFGFNICLWDKLHGTERRKNRVYNENVFYGKGKSLHEATKEEFDIDVSERNSENPLAYRSNKPEFQLDASRVDKERKTNNKHNI